MSGGARGIRVLGTSGGGLTLRSGLEFSEITVVITGHLQVEDLVVDILASGNELLVEDVEDVVAGAGEFLLDLSSESFDLLREFGVLLVLLLLLERGEDSPGGTSGADDVLVGDGEEISLFNAQSIFLVVAFGSGSDLLDVLHHLRVSLGLLGNTSHVYVLLNWIHLNSIMKSKKIEIGSAATQMPDVNIQLTMWVG